MLEDVKVNWKLYIKIFIPPLVVLTIQAILLINNAYDRIPWVDIPMHFFGGVSIGVSYYLLLKYWEQKRFIEEQPIWFTFTYILSLIAFTAVVWEFHEYALDYYFGATTQPSNADTMGDLFLGLLGGAISFPFMRKQQ